ncbi:hypothetical protein, partial [Klebsiella pneumoniae]|uniref:hypothetical protein n=1 Tax=Klebsiella pneumoniae TaxID=573 RepID=UPI001D0E5FD4
ALLSTYRFSTISCFGRAISHNPLPTPKKVAHLTDWFKTALSTDQKFREATLRQMEPAALKVVNCKWGYEFYLVVLGVLN